MRLLSTLLFAVWATLAPAAAAPRASDLVQVALMAEPDAIRPGEPFTVAVRLRMRERWHTYWRNPGDSGLGTEIAWTLPAGWTAGPISWPTPQRIPVSHLVNYGYEGETALLVQLTPPETLSSGGAVELKALVTYLVCEKECIPGEANVSTRVRVAARSSTPGPGPNRAAFDAARAALPTASPWTARVEARGSNLAFAVAAPGLKPDAIRSAYFFPYDDNAIEHAAAQTFAVDAGGLTLTLARNPTATGPAPSELSGVLVLEEALDGGLSRQAVEIGRAPAAAPPAVAAAAPPTAVTFTLLLNAALLAFGGGLLLNLMPCVFPVLSIKVLSLVRQSGGSAGAIRASGFAYTGGVLACFLALAGLLLGLRAAGAEIGWGFQLQSPAVVAGLAFLLFAMGLSLSGVAVLGTSLAGVGGGLAERPGHAGSFWTGVLAAVVATPCTAPFMGAAVGYALTAPAPAALAVFAALGLGMAAPFLLLTLWPALIGRLPRPGAWMETLKQVLAFPIYATVAWLIVVLSQQVGPDGLLAALFGLVLVAFALWALGATVGAAPIGRNLGRAAVAAALLAVVGIGASLEGSRNAGPDRVVAGGAAGTEPFSQARLDALRAENRPVLVNMTASWCITCLVNERTALGTETVRTALTDRNIVYLKGDWTNRNPEITRLLERHGRSGVPLYLAYPSRGEPELLPQILTVATVMETLDRIAPASTRRAELSPNPDRR